MIKLQLTSGELIKIKFILQIVSVNFNMVVNIISVMDTNISLENNDTLICFNN